MHDHPDCHCFTCEAIRNSRRMREARARIASGEYDRPEVLDAAAAGLADDVLGDGPRGMARRATIPPLAYDREAFGGAPVVTGPGGEFRQPHTPKLTGLPREDLHKDFGFGRLLGLVLLCAALLVAATALTIWIGGLV